MISWLSKLIRRPSVVSVWLTLPHRSPKLCSISAAAEELSMRWRQDFIRTYLERDVPQLGPRIPAETLSRFWTMLAHSQGGLLNAAALARGLSVNGKTIASYLDLMVDLLLVRRLSPWHMNVGKRLVKSPRFFVRDSGILHALLARISHRYVGRRVECVPLSTPMGNMSEWLRLKQETGCRSRKSALVATNRCLPLDKICVRRQGHPWALLQTQINNDIGR